MPNWSSSASGRRHRLGGGRTKPCAAPPIRRCGLRWHGCARPVGLRPQRILTPAPPPPPPCDRHRPTASGHHHPSSPSSSSSLFFLFQAAYIAEMEYPSLDQPLHTWHDEHSFFDRSSGRPHLCQSHVAPASGDGNGDDDDDPTFFAALATPPRTMPLSYPTERNAALPSSTPHLDPPASARPLVRRRAEEDPGGHGPTTAATRWGIGGMIRLPFQHPSRIWCGLRKKIAGKFRG